MSIRVRLRAVEPTDATAMWEVESDRESWRDNGMMAPFSLFNLQEYALNYEANPFSAGQIRLMAEIVEDDSYNSLPRECENTKLIGIADLYEISGSNRTAYVGIYVRPQFRQQGLGAEILASLEEYAKNQLNLRILGAKVKVGNAASICMFEHAGYELAGCLRGWMISGGKEYDVNLYQKHLLR